MRMLVISNMFPSAQYPNYGSFVKRVSDQLESEGADISYVVVEKSLNRIQKIANYLKFWKEVRASVKSLQFDILYVHFASHSLIPLLGMSACYQHKLVVHVHGSDMTAKSFLASVVRFFVAHIIKQARLVVVPSDNFFTLVTKRFNLAADSVFVSPSGGVDPKFTPAPKASNHSLPCIGYFSRLDKGKGWDVFLKALQLLKSRGIEFRAILAGEGSLKNQALSLISQLKLSNDVQVIDKITPDAIASIYQSFDVFVFPTELNESLGLVGLEAMACAVPVIGSNIGGLKTYIEHDKNGFLFEPSNVNDLCDKIVSFLKQGESKTLQMQAECIKTANLYSSAAVSKSLFLRLLQVMKSK